MSDHPSVAESIMREQKSEAIPAMLTSPVTLAKLAAWGMFVSVPLNMPQDIHNVDWTILFEGEPTIKSVIEVYAPGDDAGWAVVYKPSADGEHTGETELIFGRWQLVRGKHDFSRAFQKAKREAGESPLIYDASKFKLTDQELEKERDA